MKKVLSVLFVLWIMSSAVYADDNVAAANESPVISREFVFDEAPFESCHASTIVETNDGTLVAAWFGGTKEGADDVAIWSAYKEKNAEKWSEPRIVGNADDETVPCWNPVLFQPTDGPTMLFYKQGREIARWQGVLLVSHDGGRTWSKLTPTSLPNPCSGTDAVTLRDGRQLLVYNHTTTLTGGRNILNVAASDDGIVWRAVGVLENAKGEYSYPAVIQGKDGTIHITYTWRRKKIVHMTFDPKLVVGGDIVDATTTFVAPILR